MLYLYFIKQTQNVMKDTLAYYSAFHFTIGCNFKMGNKIYTYVGQTYERFDDRSETIIIVREMGTLDYKALTLKKYGEKKVAVINL